MKRRSSLRRTAAPIPVALMTQHSWPCLPVALLDEVFLLLGSLACRIRARTHALHRARAGGDRLDDVVVAGATTDVAFELFADGAVVELVALAADHIDGRHDHARRAIAALQAVIFAGRLLHRL